MERLQEYLLDQGIELGAKVLSFIFEKIYDFTSENLPKIKYKKILDFSKDFGDNFLSFFDLAITGKKDYKNDIVFQKFDIKIVNSIIRELLEKENIEERVKLKMKNDLDDFNLNNNSDNIKILLINEENVVFDIFLKIISNMFKIDKINENEFSFNIEFKTYFKMIKKVILIKNVDNLDLNKDINCVWYFSKNDFNEDENEQLKKISKKKIPIIYINNQEKLAKDKIFLNKDYNNDDENDNYLNSFNKHVIVINEINNKGNNISYLIEKSLYNILIKYYEIFFTNKCQETLNNVLKLIKFEPGNTIDNINIFIGQFLKKIFSSLIFENKTISSFGKSKIQELLNKYKEYLKSNEESYFSEFVKKSGDQFITIIKEANSKRNTKMNQKQKLTNQEIETMEVLDELEHFEIDFIEQIDVSQKEKNDKKNGDDFGIRLKNKFNDYYLEKASKYIIELVVIVIKEYMIKYYKKETFIFAMSLQSEEEILVNEIKDD